MNLFTKLTGCLIGGMLSALSTGASAATLPLLTQVLETKFDQQTFPKGVAMGEARARFQSSYVPAGWGVMAQYGFQFVDASSFGSVELQQYSDGKRVASFSILDNSNGAGGLTSPADPNCKYFVGRTHCEVAFDWGIGPEYRLVVRRLEPIFPGTKGQYWEGSVVNMHTMEKTRVGMINVEDVPGKSGYGNLSLNHTMNVQYTAAPQMEFACSVLPHAAVEWHGPFTENMGKARFLGGGYSAYQPNQCHNINVRPNGAYSVVMESGGTVRKAKEYFVDDVYSDQGYAQWASADCVFDTVERMFPVQAPNIDPNGKRISVHDVQDAGYSRDYTKRYIPTNPNGNEITMIGYMLGASFRYDTLGITYILARSGRFETVESTSVGKLSDYIEGFGCRKN